MQIVAIEGYIAHCEARGVTREVGLFLLQDEPPAVGDFVIVHLGHAIQKVSEQQAQSTWDLLDEMLALEDAGMQVRTGP